MGKSCRLILALVLLLGRLMQPAAHERQSTRIMAYATWGLTAAFVVSLFAAPAQAAFVLLAALAFAGGKTSKAAAARKS